MYKDSPDAQTRERLAMRLAALLSLFMEKHAACVGEWDVVTCVPSSARVALLPVVAKLKRFDQRELQALVAAPGEHGRTLDPDQFRVVEDVTGMRVLLLDDTFTTGAKLFSAVAALGRSGADVVGPVVLGRHVQTSWGPSEEMMRWLEKRVWSEDRCCRCAGERRDEGALF
jgi:orotate phosphoribosyltransferase